MRRKYYLTMRAPVRYAREKSRFSLKAFVFGLAMSCRRAAMRSQRLSEVAAVYRRLQRMAKRLVMILFPLFDAFHLASSEIYFQSAGFLHNARPMTLGMP